MKELFTEIEIQASPEKVWQVIIDFGRWSEGNPFIHHIDGTVKADKRVDITVCSGSKEMVLHCKVIKVILNQELCWKYFVGHPALFQGQHSFIIEPVGNNLVRFIDREIFNGLLVPLQTKDIDTNTRQGFMAMDKALKTRAEYA